MTTQVKVTTTDLASNEQQVRYIDHNIPEDRQWLGKHAFWAMRNGASVLTEPVQDEESTR